MLESPIRPAMRSPLQQALDRIGSAPAVWTPATLFAASEQGVWYDPSDFSTLFQDSAGTVPVTATGQPVGKMLDKSGRGNHATQATTSLKPLLQQDGSGKYYLAFDGVDDYMATAAVDFTATDKITTLIGLNLNSTTFGVVFETSAQSDSTNGSFYLAPQGGAVLRSQFNSSARGWSDISLAASTTAVITQQIDSAGASVADDIRARRDGGAVSSTSAGLNGSGNLGSHSLYIGRRGGTVYPFSGRIYQLIIRGALTDAAGITAAETFVNTKTAAY